MPSAGFEPAIPANKRLQTYTLDHAATVFGRTNFSSVRKVANSAIRSPETAISFPFNTCLNRRWVWNSVLMGTEGQFPRINGGILKLSVHLHIVQKPRCVPFYIHSPKYVYEVVIN